MKNNKRNNNKLIYTKMTTININTVNTVNTICNRVWVDIG